MSSPTRFPVRAFALALAVLLGAGVAAAQDRTYVCFQSAALPGDSVDPNHTDWIDAFGLDHGTSSGGGAPSFGDVAFLKGADRATPQLQRRLADGTALPKVVIDVCREDGAQDCYYTLVLQDVRVTQIDTASSSCVDAATSCTPPHTESVSLSFSTITWITNGPPVCWSLQTNSPCTPPSSSCSP